MRKRTAAEARQILSRMLDEIGDELTQEQRQALTRLERVGQLAEARGY